MNAISDRPTGSGVALRPRGAHAAPLGAAALLFAAIFVLVTVDVLGDARAFLDLWLIRAIQRIDLPFLTALFRPVDTLTGHDGAILMWAALFVVFALLRWWLPAMTMLALPVGGLLNQAVSVSVGRDRPAAGEVQRVIGGTDAAAYPSGHVVGAVLLYGLLFIVADHIGNRPLRLGMKVACVTVVLLVGLARVRAEIDTGQEHARGWMADAVAAWETDGRLTPAEAVALRAEVAAPEFQAVLPHLGAHLGISVFLRFPFGSITRFTYTATALAASTARLLFRRIDRTTWRRAWLVHSPLVMLCSVLPSVGAFAYLTAKPVRRNRLLLRVTADAILSKVPFQLYRRTGLRHLVIRPATCGIGAPRRHARPRAPSHA